MQVVTFPDLVPSIHRALDEVLSPFLSTGNPQVVMGEVVPFFKCELLYHLDRLHDKHHRPFILFASNRLGIHSTQKCLDPRVQNPNQQQAGREGRQQVVKTVYIGIPKTLPLELPPYPTPPAIIKASMEHVHRVWSQLVLVVEHEHANFNARNLHRMEIPAMPMEIQHEDFYLVRADFSFYAHYTFRRNT